MSKKNLEKRDNTVLTARGRREYTWSGQNRGLSDKDIDIPGRSFCFTGTFLFGTRAACERAVSRRGGSAVPEVGPELDYLVVGAMASEVWADMDFARNVQLAAEYQEQGSDIAIIGEEIWTRHLRPETA